MSQSRTLCIGMAVHNESIAVASVAHDHGAEVTSLGSIGTRQCDRDPLLRKRPSQATPLVFVSEAGPGGSWLSRSLTNKDDDCWGVAPSLMPTKAGDRVTTDRRDAVPLARLARSGARTAVSVPAGEEAASRDRTRAREDPRSALQAATGRLTACWLRHAIRSTGRATWRPAPLRWRAAVVCPTPAPHIVLPASVRAVNAPTARLQRLEQALQAHVPSWRVHPVVAALQALRGGQRPVAVTMVAAMGARSRCDPPRDLRPFLGLLPAEDSSGARRQPGAIPTAGTPPARRALGEGAWADRSPAPGSRPLPLRRATPPKMRQASRGKAQVRRRHRSRRLVAKGPHATVVPGAMARELVGCLGAMAKALPVTASGHKTAGPFTPHSESCRRALEEPPPRGGGTLDGVRSP
jgi:transposase